MTSLEREERKLIVLQSIDSIRIGVESVFFTIKMEEEFGNLSEDFKNGFELALALVHDAIGKVMTDVETM